MNQDEINIFLNGHVFNEQSKMAIETFETSGIDFSLLNKMGIGLFSGKEEKLKERLGYADLGRNPLLTACILIQFPHFDHQNNINYYSFKPIPAIEGRKYLLPKGTTPVPYIMPSTWEVKNKTNEPLWITEGIKKALKLSQHQRFSISISGVWNFKSSKSPDETFWLQEFEHFSWHGRHVFLGFDADLWTNPSVRYALYELGFKLLANGAIVKLPQWKNGKGVDDYLVSQENPEAALKGLEEDAALLNTFCRAEHANEVIRAVANSGLSGIAYEQSCRVLAKKLNVTPSSLKHEIENHIKRQRKDNIANSDDEITREFGQPFYIKDKGVDSLNESYWAAENYFEYIELFEPSENEFYRYEEQSGLFINISENTIKQEVSKNILKMSREIDSASLEAQRTNQNLNAIISQLRGIALKHDAFDKNNRKFVHVENGVLELDEKGGFSLKPFSPEYRSRNKNPIIFDKNAKCDRFLNELLTPAVKPGDIRVIQKYFGQCLLGNNVSQRFLILDGNAGTGKSTLAVVMQKLIGVENVTQLRTKHLAERFELFRFLKKTLLVGVDVPGDFLSEKSAQVIKGLVGGDILTAEKKGGNGTFELFGNFNLIIT
ncbi:MAG: DUF3854 domain-containing protein [Bacteroidetes bacterium]|nr:DUF3854 domain-containing protein [Bacteroidota bacterium]